MSVSGRVGDEAAVTGGSSVLQAAEQEGGGGSGTHLKVKEVGLSGVAHAHAGGRDVGEILKLHREIREVRYYTITELIFLMIGSVLTLLLVGFLIVAWVESKYDARVRSDLSPILSGKSVEAIAFVLAGLPDDELALVLSALSDDDLALVLSALSDDDLALVLAALSDDDLALVLAALPDARLALVLAALSDDRLTKWLFLNEDRWNVVLKEATPELFARIVVCVVSHLVISGRENLAVVIEEEIIPRIVGDCQRGTKTTNLMKALCTDEEITALTSGATPRGQIAEITGRIKDRLHEWVANWRERGFTDLEIVRLLLCCNQTISNQLPDLWRTQKNQRKEWDDELLISHDERSTLTTMIDGSGKLTATFNMIIRKMDKGYFLMDPSGRMPLVLGTVHFTVCWDVKTGVMTVDVVERML